METFSALLAICVRNSPVTGELPAQSQWRGALMYSLIYAWINSWVNNRASSDLRRHHAHYDVSVMTKINRSGWNWSDWNVFGIYCFSKLLYTKNKPRISEQVGDHMIRLDIWEPSG